MAFRSIERGKWLYPFISWHDPRTEAQLHWWEKNIGAEKSFQVGGNTLWRFSTALRLIWMAEHEPQILSRTHKWLLIEDFLNFMLCRRLATDYTMASCTLLFDQSRVDWSEEIMELAGIERRLLCDAYPSGTLLGELSASAAERTGLPIGTPVVLGGHDYLCGALPVGAYRPGVVLNVTGTWEIILAAIPKPILTPDVQKLGVTVETHVARNIYAIWGGAVAADMLEWYRKEYGYQAQQHAQKTGGSDWDYLMAEAQRHAGRSPWGNVSTAHVRRRLSDGGCSFARCICRAEQFCSTWGHGARHDRGGSIIRCWTSLLH